MMSLARFAIWLPRRHFGRLCLRQSSKDAFGAQNSRATALAILSIESKATSNDSKVKKYPERHPLEIYEDNCSLQQVALNLQALELMIISNLTLKGLGHAILGNFSTDQIVIELT